MLFEVGKRFPLNDYNRGIEGMFLQFQPQVVNFVGCMFDPTSSERKEWKKGDFRYGLFVKNVVPFFLFEFDGFSFDASGNIHKVAEQHRATILNADGNLSTLWLVDLRHYVLSGMRSIGMDLGIMQEFRAVLREQLERYENMTEVDRAIGGIIRSFTTADMVKQTKMKTIKRKRR